MKPEIIYNELLMRTEIPEERIKSKKFTSIINTRIDELAIDEKSLGKLIVNIRNTKIINLKQGFNYNKIKNPSELSREEIMAIGMILALNWNQTDQLLTLMRFPRLYSRNPLEAALIWTLETWSHKINNGLFDISTNDIFMNEYETLKKAYSTFDNDILKVNLPLYINKTNGLTLSSIKEMIEKEQREITKNITNENITGEILNVELKNAIDEEDFSLFVNSELCRQNLCINRRRSLYYLYLIVFESISSMISNGEYNALTKMGIFGDLSKKANINELFNTKIKIGKLYEYVYNIFQVSADPLMVYLSNFYTYTVKNAKGINKLKIKEYCGKKEGYAKGTVNFESDKYVKMFIEELRQQIGSNSDSKSLYCLSKEEHEKILSLNEDDPGYEFISEYIVKGNQYGLKLNRHALQNELCELDFSDNESYKALKQAFVLFARYCLGYNYRGRVKEDIYMLRDNERTDLAEKHADNRETEFEFPSHHNVEGFKSILNGSKDISPELFIMFAIAFKTNDRRYAAKILRYFTASGYGDIDDIFVDDNQFIKKLLMTSNKDLFDTICEYLEENYYNHGRKSPFEKCMVGMDQLYENEAGFFNLFRM